MKTRRLGKDGPEVSALGLGCWTMIGAYGEAPEAQSIASIHRALEIGYTMLDTADCYGNGENEELVGRAIRDRRDKAFIATKVGAVMNTPNFFTEFDGSPAYIHQACEDSLRRLGTDHIDLYHLHRIDPATPVIFIDSGKLFHHTLTYRDILVRRLGLSDVRTIEPAPFDLGGHDPDGALWQRNPNLCCYLRKVLPLERTLDGFDAWITGRKRDHGGERGGLETIEAVDGRIRLNPLARWSSEKINSTFEARGLPRHPLSEEGYASIGCAPCTTPVSPDANARDGRWQGRAKSECGIHHARWSSSLQ